MLCSVLNRMYMVTIFIYMYSFRVCSFDILIVCYCLVFLELNLYRIEELLIYLNCCAIILQRFLLWEDLKHNIMNYNDLIILFIIIIYSMVWNGDLQLFAVLWKWLLHNLIINKQFHLLMMKFKLIFILKCLLYIFAKRYVLTWSQFYKWTFLGNKSIKQDKLDLYMKHFDYHLKWIKCAFLRLLWSRT